jgi:hypothetical protein
MEAIRCQKIQPLKLDNAYFGSTEQISKHLIVDPRVTYCTGIKRFDYLDLIKWKLFTCNLAKLQTVLRNI